MAEVLEPMVTLMITSIKSTEGIKVCIHYVNMSWSRLVLVYYLQLFIDQHSAVDCPRLSVARLHGDNGFVYIQDRD